MPEGRALLPYSQEHLSEQQILPEERKQPHTEVPTVVPRLVEARKSPFAKSGAFGAAVASQY